MISTSMSHNSEIHLNVSLPPDFNTVWKQAAQQGFKPKLATVTKVLLFPADVTTLGSLANNIPTNSWWSFFAPYRSALDGETAACSPRHTSARLASNGHRRSGPPTRRSR